jgi:hypothetical protein
LFFINLIGFKRKTFGYAIHLFLNSNQFCKKVKDFLYWLDW